MRKFIRFLTLYFAPFVSALLILLRVKRVDAYLIEHGIPPWTIGVSLAAGIILVHVFTIISPYKKYEKLDKNKWVLFSYLAEKLKRDYKKGKNGFDLRVNIMVPQRRILFRAEPSTKKGDKKRFSWWGKIFEIVWESEQAYTSKRLEITTNQGVCGMAYRDGKLYAKDLTGGKSDEYNFTNSQYKLTSDLTFVISCPIFKEDSHYSGRPTGKVIGVLNIESSARNANQILNSNVKFVELCEEIISISNVCSKIL